MEIKEAIESVEDTYNIHENDRSSSDEGTERIFRQRDEVITLLQQGEAATIENIELKKYKKIVNELDKVNIGEDGEFGYRRRKLVAELKQKYFPEGIPK